MALELKYHCCRDGEVLMVDEDVEEGARDLLELNDDGGFSMSSRKRGRCKKEIFFPIAVPRVM